MPQSVLVFGLAALVALTSCAKEKKPARAERDAIAWLTSYEAALKTAKDERRPVMIDFYTDWCGWCKRLDADTYVDKQVISASGDFVSLKINADAERAIAARYNITGFPTILFIDSSGQEVYRVVGYQPPQAFLVEMGKAMAAFKEKS
ncbi:MAG TPA: thioredoxin domain-containing protein [bacterium]|nr:thioredoxin domain-containing protein [bacterium]